MKKGREQESFMQWLMPSKLTIILFAFYALLIGLFLWFLDVKTGTGFGIVEVMFALLGSLALVSVLVFIRRFQLRNSYLGLIIGLVTVGYLVYAIIIRYWGPYTMVFTGIGALVTVLYLVIHFFKSREAEYGQSRNR